MVRLGLTLTGLGLLGLIGSVVCYVLEQYPPAVILLSVTAVLILANGLLVHLHLSGKRISLK